MIRSGAPSSAARAIGYSIAAACVAMFAYMLVIVTSVAINESDGGVWVWAAAWAGTPLIATVVLTVYVWRQPHTGGYALVGVASLVGAFFCMIAILPGAAI